MFPTVGPRNSYKTNKQDDQKDNNNKNKQTNKKQPTLANPPIEETMANGNNDIFVSSRKQAQVTLSSIWVVWWLMLYKAPQQWQELGIFNYSTVNHANLQKLHYLCIQ